MPTANYNKFRKRAKKASNVLRKEEEYFMLMEQEFKKLKQLVDSGIRTQEVLEQMKDCVKRIKWQERKEFWFASVGKLGSKIEGIPMSVNARSRIQSLIREMRALEARIIVTDTMDGLKRQIEDKTSAMQVDWERVKKIVGQGDTDLLGLIRVEEETKRILR